jgi:hypothetical protein
MLSRLLASAHQGRTVRCAGRVITANPKTSLVNQTYFGLFMTQGQNNFALQTNATFAPSASRLFARNYDEDREDDFRPRDRRDFKDYKQQVQLQPEDVMESMKSVNVDALNMMSNNDLQQFMNKVVRAFYISPKLFT